jgi:solute carrier family 25 oxoglutarate transporter 11
MSQTPNATAPKKQPSTILNFALGGISGSTATLFIQPIDMIKVRIQLLSELGHKNLNPFKVGKEIMQKDGLFSLYRGLDSAIVRQLFYGTTRLGLFYSFLDHFKTQNKGSDPTIVQKSISSFFAGGIAALVANPADLILVRMQADGTLPVEQRRNYKNVFDGFSKIVKTEGVANLWRGAFPSIQRACIINLALLAPFEEFKQRLKNVISNVQTRTIVSSLMASLIGSVASLPMDNAKTKLQKMKPDANGQLPYKGIVDCLSKTIVNEGVSKLWVGLPTYYVRIGPHVIITLVLNDYLRSKFI